MADELESVTSALLDNPVNLDSYRREQPVKYWLP
jgi:hypothetical protein